MNAPSWQQELLNFKGIKSLFVLEKNISDFYPSWDGATTGVEQLRPSFLDLRESALSLFSGETVQDKYQIVRYSPIHRFLNPSHDQNLERYLSAAEQATAEMRLEDEQVNSFAPAREASRESPLVHDSLLIRALISRSLVLASESVSQVSVTSELSSVGDDARFVAPSVRPIVVLIDMASRLLSSASSLDQGEISFFSNLLIAGAEALRVDGRNRNTLVFIANNARDLPEWFIAGNPDLRTIVVPMPDRDMREVFVRETFGVRAEPMRLGGKSSEERFIDMTDGMSLRELDEIRRMYARAPSQNDLCELVDLYKFGLRENKWASMADKLENDPASLIERRVKGQEQAVRAVVSVLKRSVLGLSGSTHSSSSKPKGVLFLSGPTGTGKTEIVKTVTELLFGDERSCLRFDMSEYQGDSSDQKLFGAPPGYVGYAQGGQLTNAVRANPFSVLLFDEIEKASPSIMDKFLQILEDGRMTDGQGNTVYFSETIIFFTSNIGFSQEVFDPSGRHVVNHVNLIEPDEPYEDMCVKVQQEMSARFKPEFLGRVGNNIVVFNFIDDETAAAIVEQKIDGVNRNVERQVGVTVEVDQECTRFLMERALEPEVKAKGGRGIANLVESAYLNMLSSFLFDAHIGRGDTVRPRLNGDRIGFEQDGGKHA